ncbi:hypothetical protein SAMN05877838_0214 [Hoeflea halophila]|uniref:Uncharacterized protein n=1 Tax=Hoeflea halophila TaxID=714899 RepID=A0A286HL48_9HYPH|nr:hypothetical protein [Hoeflea halophila]SOE08492.1 hypothetical protein SAMN05877838_0214 [Hoeflea halophila]
MAPKLIEFNGKRYLISEITDLTGIPRETIRARIAAGWSIEEAIGTPTPKLRRAGVGFNLLAFQGTGGGSTSQESPNITFSEKAEDA